MPRIELVNATSLAEEAAHIMRESWRQPCVYFTSSYLQWQFNYRGDYSAISAAAFDGGRLIGQAAIVPRRLTVNGRMIDAFHLSFVCVLPEYRGQGLASRLYRSLLNEIAERKWPFVAFTLRDSPGYKTFLSGTKATGFQVQSLGEYIVHGYLYRPTHPSTPDPSISISIAGPNDVSAYIDFVHSSIDDRTLGVYADEETVKHWSIDPRQSRRVLARRDGEIVGAVRLARAQVASQRGIEPITSVEHMFLRSHDASVVKALANEAGATWSNGVAPEYVSFANVGRVNETVIRDAGIRKTHTVYLGFLGIPPGYEGQPLDHIDHTNMTVA